MTDRELLELAAKAAGRPVWAWNPLDDDGDALRLAVKLKLNVNVEHTSIDVYDQSLKLTRVWATEIDDACAATRRAIVRAAAAIGMEMK